VAIGAAAVAIGGAAAGAAAMKAVAAQQQPPPVRLPQVIVFLCTSADRYQHSLRHGLVRSCVSSVVM
jgi:hypothetical protein